MSTLDRVSTQAAQVRELEPMFSLVRDARYELRKALKAAHEAGYSYRAIAQAAGISHQRVAQLLQKEEK